MQADEDDRYMSEARASSPAKMPLLLVAAVVVVGLAWYFLSPSGEQAPPQEPAPEMVPAPAPEPPAPVTPTEPDIPEPTPDVVPAETVSGTELPEPALTLEESDAPVQAMLAPQVADTPLATVLGNNDLITRAASLIDATSQGRAFPEVLKLPPPEGKFLVVEREGAHYIDPASYQRYDAYAQAVASVDPQQLASAFNEFRPLLEEAYAALGYREEDLDNALVRALDQVIAAPVLQRPAQVEKNIATWHYTDASLEELPSLAKLLMRMGPENQALIQSQAKAVREALLSQDEP